MGTPTSLGYKKKLASCVGQSYKIVGKGHRKVTGKCKVLVGY